MKAGRFWVVFFAAFVSDQATKSWAERNAYNLRDHPMVVFDFIDGYEALVEFTYVTNPGAAWSMFSDYPQVLTALAGLALIGIFFFRRQLELNLHGPQIIFGFISGGIAGNLWDRLFRTPREVVDFIDVYLPLIEYDYPIFNVADSCIFVGVLTFLVRGFRESAREKEAAKAEEDIVDPEDEA